MSEPPSLHGPQPRGDCDAIDNETVASGDDYRREAVEAILADGTWQDVFEECAGSAGLSPASSTCSSTRG